MLAGNLSRFQPFMVLLFSGALRPDDGSWKHQALLREEYIKASFKGYWKHFQCIWVLVDMHSLAPWANRLLYPPVIKDQRKKPLMTACLSALVKCVAELRQAGLEACHCVEEFHLRWIHPLGHWEKLAYECPRLADLNRYPAELEILTPPFNYCTNPHSDLACFLP
jgi:hypothetical protein